MPGTILRWLGGGLALAFIVGAVLTVSQCRDNLREEGRQEVTQTIQKESINNLLEEREVTSRVLLEWEGRRGINDKASTQAQKKIYEAKETAHDLDTPLPDSITRPLLMQYQAITACSQSGEDAPASGAHGRASNARTAKGADHTNTSTLDK